MAAKTTFNAKNLETLGPKRLAELLIEISSRDAAPSDADAEQSGIPPQPRLAMVPCRTR